MNSTLNHYNRVAQAYAEVNHTLSAVSPDRDAFVSRLLKVPGAIAKNMRILDAGSGTGRDTLAFSQLGFTVDAFDGSEAMCDLSSRLTGRKTRLMRFEDLDLPVDYYDGVWAMASLLHVPRANLPQVINQLGASLRPGGLLFASFKNGTQDRIHSEDGRAFTDLDRSQVEAMLDGMVGWDLVDTTLRSPPQRQSNQEPWFSMTLCRPGIAPTFKMSGRKPRIP